MENSKDNQEYPIPDLTYLRDMTDGDEESLKEVISIFLDEAPRLMQLMKESADSGDHDSLKFSTHKLVTQLTYVGITSVIPDVKLINTGSSKMSDLKERVDKIVRVVEHSMIYLKTLI
jgi:hypothetical protein